MSQETGSCEPRVLPRPEHPISRKNVDSNALKVLYRLHRSGFKAYLVGGGVRDLMLGLEPKDFDVVTDARPEEIRRLFRNSRIIGRRFRLAHVFFRSGIVEVSTFRRDPDPAAQDSGPQELLITDDNTYGTPREDAFRRDFTVNALFYSIDDFSVIDYCGGLDDLDRRLMRVIGEPSVRFQEDPVRMLRACELAGRLGFAIERRTQEGIAAHRRDLAKASPARLTEELVDLLRCGSCGAAVQWMWDLELVEVLVPEAHAMVEARQRGLDDLGRLLPAVDTLTAKGREVADGALLAVLLLPKLLLERYSAETEAGKPLSRSAAERLVRQVTQPFIDRYDLSRARTQSMLDALDVFWRLGETGASKATRRRLGRQPGFPGALFLLELMVMATGRGREVLDDWRQVEKEAPAGGGERGGRSRSGGGGRRKRGRGGARRRRRGRGRGGG